MIQETPTTLEELVRARNISGSFSILTRAYEEELDRKYGIKLRELKNGERSAFRGDLQNNMPFNALGSFSPAWVDASKVENRVLNKYPSTPGFCCMHLNDERELLEHVRFIYEVSYNHYVGGKECDISFPNYCCGVSANNLLLTLMLRGYPNASRFDNSKFDHVYNGLPFVLGDNKEKGFIIIDPTSDQLFRDKRRAPRNHLFVVFGTTWEYRTDWEQGADLFPSEQDYSDFTNLHILREKRRSTNYNSRDMDKYFREVFKNPVKVKRDTLDCCTPYT